MTRFEISLVEDNATGHGATTDGTDGDLVAAPLASGMAAHENQVPRPIQTDGAASLKGSKTVSIGCYFQPLAFISTHVTISKEND